MTEPRQLPNWIGGQAVHPAVESPDVLNPATGARLARLPRSGAAEVDAATRAAKAAGAAWGRTSVEARARVLEAVADRIEARLDELAELESQDQGKPVSLARAVDIPRAVANFRFFAGLLREREQEIFEMPDATNYVIHKPVGVRWQLIG